MIRCDQFPENAFEHSGKYLRRMSLCGLVSAGAFNACNRESDPFWQTFMKVRSANKSSVKEKGRERNIYNSEETQQEIKKRKAK